MTPPDRSDRSSGDTHPVGVPETEDSAEALEVECYVRSNVSRISVRQIETIQERLDALSETPLVADHETVQWPPQEHTNADSISTEQSRRELVREFREWADEHGCSLEPAFRRRTVPGSLAETEGPSEKICVPIVTLALYGEETGSLRGVVPYTTNPGTDIARTYTVDDWLTAVKQGTAAGDATRTPRPVDTSIEQA